MTHEIRVTKNGKRLYTSTAMSKNGATDVARQMKRDNKWPGCRISVVAIKPWTAS